MDGGWSVYIIKCRTRDLYVGIAKDVRKRVELHNQGKACRYTKFRRPVRLIYSKACGDYNTAREEEQTIKKFSRVKKLALVEHQISRPAGAGFRDLLNPV